MHYLGYRLVQFNNIKAIFFDLDGTLFETAPELVGAINNMLSDLKMPPLENNQITNFIGRGADNLIRKSIELSSKKSSDDWNTTRRGVGSKPTTPQTSAKRPIRGIEYRFLS